MGSYINQDGLRQGFGADEIQTTAGGAVGAIGDNGLQSVVLDIDMTDVSSTQAVLDYGVIFPKNALIKSVELFVSEAVVGAITLDLGLSDSAGVEIDFNGFASLSSVAALGTTVVGAGALINTKLVSKGVLSAKANAASTAGKVHVTITYLAG